MRDRRSAERVRAAATTERVRHPAATAEATSSKAMTTAAPTSKTAMTSAPAAASTTAMCDEMHAAARFMMHRRAVPARAVAARTARRAVVAMIRMRGRRRTCDAERRDNEKSAEPMQP